MGYESLLDGLAIPSDNVPLFAAGHNHSNAGYRNEVPGRSIVYRHLFGMLFKVLSSDCANSFRTSKDCVPDALNSFRGSLSSQQFTLYNVISP
jgi:hypothetical protein